MSSTVFDRSQPSAERGRGGVSRHAHAPTLADLIHTWYRLHGCTLRDEKTRLSRTLAICERLGNPTPEQLTASRFAEYRAERLKEVTPSTVNHEHRYLKAVVNELIRFDLWELRNPLQAIRQIPIQEQELQYLTLEQIEKVLQQCRRSRNPYVTTIAKICLATGARWCEAEGLHRKHLSGGLARFVNTKNGRFRAVPLPAALVEEALEVGQAGEALFSASRTAFRCAYRRTGYQTPQQLTHILRHTFASHYMMNGGNILELQKILGHTDLKMTLRYAHLSPDHLARALDLSPIGKAPELLSI